MKKTNTPFSSVSMRLIAFAIMFISINSCKKINEDDPSKQPSLESFAVARIVKSITSFGAVGDGRTDNYSAFVRAAAFAAKNPNTTINFPAGTYYIAKYRKIKNDPIDHIWWRNCKGLKLIGEAGTKISFNGDFFRPLSYTLSDNSRKSYTSGLSFWFEHCTDLEIRNFEMTGNVQKTTRGRAIDIDNPAVTESQNIMLRFTMCDQVVIDNIYAHHAECDGLKIGGDRINGVWINSTNFTVTNVRANNNGRLGMSIGGLDHGYFKNCVFNNNGFTDGDYGHNDPAGGVDIEPGEFHHNDNIKFESCKFENSFGNNFMCTAPNNTKNITLLKCFITTVTETHKTQGITILAKNTIIDQCTLKLKKRVMKFTNPLKPGSTIKFTNSLIETSGNCWSTNSLNMADKVVMSGNQINFTENVMTKNVIQLQMANMQFLNNRIFIPAAAVKSRPTGSHANIQNALISEGNKFYSEKPTVKPKVDYTGTKVVADL